MKAGNSITSKIQVYIFSYIYSYFIFEIRILNKYYAHFLIRKDNNSINFSLNLQISKYFYVFLCTKT